MKLCVIGGAGARSAFLTKSLVKSAREIRVDHIVLLDNNEEHLRTYGQISKELARRMEPSLTFDITSDARGALTGADYIITTIRAGGDAGRLFDEKTGEEFRLSDDRLTITPENSARYLDLFAKIASQRRKATLLRPMIKGLLYELLCTISLELQRSDLMTRRFAPIYPAIKYIRGTDISELDAAGLPGLCHLS